MSKEITATPVDEEFGYDVMNAATNTTALNFKDLYYCQPNTSKTKTCNNLPNYPTLVKVIITK